MPSLYSDVILDHFRQPRNYGSLSNPDISYEDFNPLCGDRIRIEVKIDQSRVEEARFKGDGCAISVAAASVLTELIARTELEDVEGISDESFLAILKSEITPSRLQCALLPLQALRSGLRTYKETRKH